MAFIESLRFEAQSDQLIQFLFLYRNVVYLELFSTNVQFIIVKLNVTSGIASMLIAET